MFSGRSALSLSETIIVHLLVILFIYKCYISLNKGIYNIIACNIVSAKNNITGGTNQWDSDGRAWRMMAPMLEFLVKSIVDPYNTKVCVAFVKNYLDDS